MHGFLLHNRDELIARCKAKVEERPRRAATSEQLANGVPLFLSQLTRTLQAEGAGEDAQSILIGDDKELRVYYGDRYPYYGLTALDLTGATDEELHHIAEAPVFMAVRPTFTGR